MWKNIRHFFQLLRKLTNRVVIGDPLLIHGYRSFGNDEKMLLRGRILENEGISVQKDDNFWRNMINNVRRFEIDEIRKIPVDLDYHGQSYQVMTNKEGYFTFHIPVVYPQNQELVSWETASLSLPQHKYKTKKKIRDEIQVMWAGWRTQYGIISDIDDTILMSHIGSLLKWKMIYVTLFQNVYQRKPFEGMSETLRHLAYDESDLHINPTFYVSNSPWTLYEVLEEFLKIHKMPAGPILLRDYGAFFGKELSDFRNHKSQSIDYLFGFYPQLAFILIGDATEMDADIYLEKFDQYPGRVKAIFIRQSRKKEDNLRVIQLFATYPDAPCFMVEHSEEIMRVMSDEL